MALLSFEIVEKTRPASLSGNHPFEKLAQGLIDGEIISLLGL